MASYELTFNGLMVLFLLMVFLAMPGTAARLHGMASTTNNGEDLITTTCNNTLYFDECVCSLRSDPWSETADINGLAAIALNLSITEAMKILPFIINLNNTLAVSDPQTEFESRCLGECIGEYLEAVEYLQEATQALTDKSYDEVNRLVTDAMTDSVTCEDGFAEGPDGHSPFTHTNQYFEKLCSILLAITKLLT
ncbi:putative invertase inhibitor [Cornus florida]|uniref:putative invertase inhibitor n=1 Tax=Cornus florida TaxID=4283 RepID=UPI00289CACE1|nr:putative invertase inhibitor [Cornus florida]